MAIRLTIANTTLEEMGDALRVHFGENISEGEVLHFDSSPRVMSAGGYEEFGTSSKKVARDPNDPNDLLWHPTTMKKQHYVMTYQVHGAARLKLQFSYRTDEGSYFWFAEGAHKDESSLVGQTLMYTYGTTPYCSKCQSENVMGTGIYRDVGYWEGDSGWFESVYTDELHVCNDCGALGYTYSKDASGLFEYGLVDTQGYTTIFPHSGEMERTIQTLEFEGDTFTFICHVPIDDFCIYTGYYAYLYAYDADGNEITSYDMTKGRVPNDYSPAEMVEAIGKLNNYPDAKEVPF